MRTHFIFPRPVWNDQCGLRDYGNEETSRFDYPRAIVVVDRHRSPVPTLAERCQSLKESSCMNESKRNRARRFPWAVEAPGLKTVPDATVSWRIWEGLRCTVSPSHSRYGRPTVHQRLHPPVYSHIYRYRSYTTVVALCPRKTGAHAACTSTKKLAEPTV